MKIKLILSLYVFVFIFLNTRVIAENNVLESMVQNVAKDVIENDYDEGKKWVAYVSGKVPGVADLTLAVDLYDYVGASDEGQSGWVTVWLDTSIGSGASKGLFPISIGAEQRPFSEVEPDDSGPLFSASIGANVAGIKLSVFNSNSDGETKLVDYGWDGWNSDIGVGAGFTFSGITLEVKKEVLDSIIDKAIIPGIDSQFSITSLATF